MSEKVKKLRVKQKDGTMSDYIPIGSDAKYVDTENGSTVEVELSKTTKYYDCVADMKKDTHLRGGAAAVTLGYYKPNDGGGALYQIIDATAADFDTLTDDGGSVHDLENDLKAKLIIKNGIKVEQFGAYGDGEHDDTNAIQKAINYGALVVNSNLVGINTIYLNGGIYKITDTIIFYPYVKIKTLNNSILTTTIDKTLLKLDATNQTLSNIEYNLTHLIDGTNGLRLENTGENNLNSIGLEVVNYNNSNRKTCNFTVKSIALSNFNIGIKLTNYNLYLVKFEELSIQGNIGIQFGDSENKTQFNTGENIVFYRCVFVNNIAINYYVSGTDCNFLNCSFDYCDLLFNDSTNTGYRKILIDGGHIEATKTGIINTSMKYSSLIITGCKLLNDPKVSLFGTSIPCDLIIKNNDICLLENPTQKPSNNFLLPYSPHGIIKDNKVGYGSIGMPISKNNLILHYNFDNASIETIEYQKNKLIGSYTMDESKNISSIECIDTDIFEDDVSGHIIKITKTDASNPSYLVLYSDFIPVKVNEKYRGYVCGKNCFASNVLLIGCYDINKNKIKTLSNYYFNNQESNTDGEYKITKHYSTFTIPKNTSFIKVGYYFGNNDNSINNFEIGGIILEDY